MKPFYHSLLSVWIAALVWGAGPGLAVSGAEAAADRSRPAVETAEPVTIKGMVLNHVHSGEKNPSVFVYALDGPGPIKSEFEKILADYYPERGLDADAARALLDQFTARLKYFLDGPLAEKLEKDATYNARQVMAVTGVVSERDSRKWITATKCEPTQFQYPARLLSPDKPFVMPDKPPLVLKVTENLSLKCVWVPPGRFLMGEPYYMCPHWQEDPPHMVTLTRAFYLAETPGHVGNVRRHHGRQNSRHRSDVHAGKSPGQ